MEIQFVSAPWCKACSVIKPDFIAHCKLIGIEPMWINYDEMDEEFQGTIKALPTIKVRTDTDWTYYTKDTFEAWKDIVMAYVLKTKTDDF